MSPALLILLIVMAPVAIVIPWLACVAVGMWLQGPRLRMALGRRGACADGR